MKHSRYLGSFNISFSSDCSLSSVFELIMSTQVCPSVFVALLLAPLSSRVRTLLVVCIYGTDFIARCNGVKP